MVSPRSEAEVGEGVVRVPVGHTSAPRPVSFRRSRSNRLVFPHARLSGGKRRRFRRGQRGCCVVRHDLPASPSVIANSEATYRQSGLLRKFGPATRVPTVLQRFFHRQPNAQDVQSSTCSSFEVPGSLRVASQTCTLVSFERGDHISRFIEGWYGEIGIRLFALEGACSPCTERLTPFRWR